MKTFVLVGCVSLFLANSAFAGNTGYKPSLPPESADLRVMTAQAPTWANGSSGPNCGADRSELVANARGAFNRVCVPASANGN